MDARASAGDLFARLDASQRDLQHRVSVDLLSPLKPQRRDAISSSLFSASDSVICWTDGNRLFANGQCVEEFTEAVVALALRQDCDVVAAVTERRLLTRGVSADSPATFSLTKQEPSFATVAWHPTNASIVGTAFRAELTVWFIESVMSASRAKVFHQTSDVASFVFASGNLVWVAVSTGALRAVDIATEAVIWEIKTNAEFLIAAPTASVCAVAKTRAELTVWHSGRREKTQSLALTGVNVTLVTAYQNLIFIVDAPAKRLSVAVLNESSQFSFVRDFLLDTEAPKSISARLSSKGEVELLCLEPRGVSVFLLQELGSLLLSSRCDPFLALNRRLDGLTAKLDSVFLPAAAQTRIDKTVSAHLDQLSGIIKDEQQKIQVSMKVLLAQAFKEQFQTAITPLFEGAVKEMFTQVTVGFQEGIKEFTERNAVEEAQFASVMQHMKSSVDSVSELTGKIGKLAYKQLQRVSEAEAKQASVQAAPQAAKPEVRAAGEVPALKLELDRLLRNGEFEAATSLALAEPDERLLYRVLRLINPQALYSQQPLSNSLSLRVCHRILTHFPTPSELPEYLLWLQVICKTVALKGEDPNLLQYILEMMLSRCKTSPEIAPAKELFFSKIMQDMQERRR